MRSSKHSKKKGILGSSKRKSVASRHTSEINEDFLAEFRDLEQEQEEAKEYIQQTHNDGRKNDDVHRVDNDREYRPSQQPYEPAHYERSFFERKSKGQVPEEDFQGILSDKYETSVNINDSEYARRIAAKSNSNNEDVRVKPSKSAKSVKLSRADNQQGGSQGSTDEDFETKIFSKNSDFGDAFERNAMKNSVNYKEEYEEYKEDLLNESKKDKKKKSKKDKGDRKKKKKKDNSGGSNKGKKVKKVILILILLVAVCAGAAYYYIDVQMGKMAHVDTNKAEFEIDRQVAKDLKGYRNVALMGIDARKGEDAKNCRTDAIIVASLDKKTGDVALISVMRDSYLEMDSSTGDIMYDKATHAHVYGGPVNTCKMLNKSLDLNISEFVVMDWNSVADTVDALGGITVDVKDNEIWDLNHWGPETAANTDRTWTEIYNTGKQKIDGAQAATYCRIRKNSGGDTGRTERMRKVVMAILKEVKSNPTKITTVADKVLPEVRTNMSTLDITSLLPQVIKFDIKDSIGYPFNYYGGSVNGSWKAVPTTLSENAVRLHKEAFKQDDYVPTARLEQISQNIISNTGISQGYEE